MSPFRIAFVGIDHPHGAGWRESLANLGEAVAITAIVPRFGGTTYNLEERHSGLPRFETVAALIAAAPQTFDGAIVCLPNAECPAAAAAFARAGKHVLVEKPGASSATEARPIIDAVRGSQVAFQSGYLWRYDPGANRLLEMVRDGRFGKLISIEMAFTSSDVSRRGPGHYLFDPGISGRGFFNWLACHWIDLLLYVTGRSVTNATARVGTFGDTPTEMEDGGAAILELEGGALATFVGGYWLPRWTSESHWTIRGSQRWVHWDPMRTGTGGVLTIHGPQPQFQAMEECFTLPADSMPGYGGARCVALLEDWIAQARGGAPCRNSPESLLATLEVLDRIYESSATGRRVIGVGKGH